MFDWINHRRIDKHFTANKILGKALEQKQARNGGNDEEEKRNYKFKNVFVSSDNVKISHVSSSFLLSLFMCMFACWHVAKIYC